MPEKEVIIIEPEIQNYQENNTLIIDKPKKRVCAYARVSTDSTDQLNSYQAQIREFTKRIKENNEWKFLGMYADEGISGTNMKKRTDFLRMIEDAKAGKIDLILTKSLSRFARNTVDCLTVVRELRNHNVEVFFEKENLYSSDTKIDFMLTIFSSIAQEEARNISENVKWGFRKRFKEGKVHINTKRFLGYDKDEKGKIVINENEAQTIKIIFNMYIAGSSLKEIADYLTENNIKNGRGVVFWTPASIGSILTNEKYCGDAILQKRVVTDYLSHRSIKNTGQAPKYYIKNNHEPIISRETFEFVQALKKKRSKNTKSTNYKSRYPLSGIVYCAHCGRIMNRHYYNYGKPTQRITLSCKNRYRDHVECINKPIDNNTLEMAVIDSIKHLNLFNKKLFNETINLVQSSLDVTSIYNEINSIKKEIENVEDEIKEIINIEVSKIKDNTDFYRELYNEKKANLTSLKTKLENKKSQLVDKHLHKERIRQISDFLKDMIPFNQNIVSSIYKAIFSTSKHDVFFVITNEELTIPQMLEMIESNKFTVIYENKIEGKYYVDYKIVKLDDNYE